MKKILLILVIFLILSVVVYSVPYFKIDLVIAGVVQKINFPVFEGLMKFVSYIGDKPLMIVIIGVTGVILYLFGRRTEAVIGTLAAAGSTLSGSLIKMIIHRPRPSGELVRISEWLSDKSYPSGHVLAFTVFFGFLLYWLNRRSIHKNSTHLLSLIFILLIASIGISRIYLGVHWPSDVLGGYMLGIIWLFFTIKIYNSYHGQR